MTYVVNTPLNIAGRRREIGELLQEDEVRNPSVIRSGFVTRLLDPADFAVETANEDRHISAPIITKKGTEVISVSETGICEVILLMQKPQAEAISAIETATDLNMLQILGACVSAAKVKTAIKARIEALTGEAEAKGGK